MQTGSFVTVTLIYIGFDRYCVFVQQVAVISTAGFEGISLHAHEDHHQNKVRTRTLVFVAKLGSLLIYSQAAHRTAPMVFLC
jgi:hypothetical protein